VPLCYYHGVAIPTEGKDCKRYIKHPDKAEGKGSACARCKYGDKGWEHKEGQ